MVVNVVIITGGIVLSIVWVVFIWKTRVQKTIVKEKVESNNILHKQEDVIAKNNDLVVQMVFKEKKEMNNDTFADITVLVDELLMERKIKNEKKKDKEEKKEENKKEETEINSEEAKKREESYKNNELIDVGEIDN